MSFERFSKGEKRPASLMLRIAAREREALKFAAFEANQSVSEYTRTALKLDAIIEKYKDFEFTITKTK